jgi:hypothetical protein
MGNADPRRDDEATGIDIRGDERRLAGRFADEAPEYELAHEATTQLAVALDAAARLQLPADEPERSLTAVVLISSARVFRLARAGMTVLAAGYEVEARALDRSLVETRARRMQVLADESGELAREWLAGRPRGGWAAAVRETAPREPDRATSFYRTLSGDVHPDLRQFIASLAHRKPSGSSGVTFSPGRTPHARRSLLMYTWFAGEAAAEVADRTDVELPDDAELRRALLAAAEQVERDLPAGEAGQRRRSD